MKNSNSFSNIKDILLCTTDYLSNLIQDPNKYFSLIVPDETRRIADKVDIKEIKKLYDEFYELSIKLRII